MKVGRETSDTSERQLQEENKRNTSAYSLLLLEKVFHKAQRRFEKPCPLFLTCVDLMILFGYCTVKWNSLSPAWPSLTLIIKHPAGSRFCSSWFLFNVFFWYTHVHVSILYVSKRMILYPPWPNRVNRCAKSWKLLSALHKVTRGWCLSQMVWQLGQVVMLLCLWTVGGSQNSPEETHPNTRDHANSKTSPVQAENWTQDPLAEPHSDGLEKTDWSMLQAIIQDTRR